MKKICLVADVPNWAFDIIAKNIKKQLGYKYDIRVDYVDENSEELFECIERNSDCDLIHFFWRKALLKLESDVFKQKVKDAGIDYDEYINEKKTIISTGVYDFLYLTDEGIEKYKNVFNKYVKKYYVSSKKLYNVYKNISEYREPNMVVHDICDSSKFKPINLERFDNDKFDNNELVIGWVGNSARKVGNVDLKGLYVIIKPVIEELRAEGYNLSEFYADRNVRWRTTEEMPEYYSKIDLCLCTSIHEGTPLPILEAMYCGVPVITTDVGIVREALGEMQKRYIIGDRKNGENDSEVKELLKQKIIEIYNDRSILKELSEENMKSILEYDGGKIINEFEKYFDLF